MADAKEIKNAISCITYKRWMGDSGKNTYCIFHQKHWEECARAVTWNYIITTLPQIIGCPEATFSDMEPEVADAWINACIKLFKEKEAFNLPSNTIEIYNYMAAHNQTLRDLAKYKIPFMPLPGLE
jgi:hypothetical protein